MLASNEKLPRAYQWLDSAAYVHRVELLYQARDAELPENLRSAPLMAQGCGDALLGACDPMVCASADFGVDFGAGLAVVSGDIPMGCTAERALDGVRLLMLVNSMTLHHLTPVDSCDAFGWLHCRHVDVPDRPVVAGAQPHRQPGGGDPR